MATVEQLEALQSQFNALRRAGVVQHPYFSADQRQLENAGEVIRRQAQRGDSLEEVLQAPIGMLPESFRQAALVGVRCGDVSAGFEQTWVPIDRSAELRRHLTTALVYPFIVAVVAYLLLIFLCCVTVPRLEQTTSQMLLEPSGALRWASLIRTALPVWAPIVGGGLLVGLLWFLISGRGHTALSQLGLFRFVPGARRVASDLQLAQVADLASRLVERGVPDEDSLAAAQRATFGNAETKSSSPPFLAWANSFPATKEDRSAALKLASQLYDDRADFHGRRMRTIIPNLAMALFAGGMVMLYAFTFWKPFCDLMVGIANQDATWMGR